jgi:hypothetical protein
MAVDHIVRGLSRLPSQFQDKTRVLQFFSVFLEELQEIEECLEDIITQKDLNFAVGAQLDILGNIIGAARDGQTDEDYRQSIILQRAINSSKGTEELVTEFWKKYSGTSYTSIYENFPAGISLFTDAGVPSLDSILKIKQVLAATVSLSVTFSTGTPFAFEGVDGAGFGDLETSVGGAFVGTTTF